MAAKKRSLAAKATTASVDEPTTESVSASPSPLDASPPEGGSSGQEHSATVLYPGAPKGRATIELRIRPDGSNEAFLVPSGATPIATGISLVEKKGKYYIYCRIRKKLLAFKPEEIVRQRTLNWLIDDLNYDENQIAVEVGVTMGSTVHEKPADIVVYTDSSKERAWIVSEVKTCRTDTQTRKRNGVAYYCRASWPCLALSLPKKPA